MRDALQKNPEMSAEEAVQLIDRCMRLLYYRDKLAYYKVSSYFYTPLYSPPLIVKSKIKDTECGIQNGPHICRPFSAQWVMW